MVPWRLFAKLFSSIWPLSLLFHRGGGALKDTIMRLVEFLNRSYWLSLITIFTLVHSLRRFTSTICSAPIKFYRELYNRIVFTAYDIFRLKCVWHNIKCRISFKGYFLSFSTQILLNPCECLKSLNNNLFLL